MSLADIVNVQISRGTKAVSRLGFGTALALVESLAFAETRTYSSNKEVQADADLNAGAKALATAYFGQDLKPKKLKIARRTAKVAGVNTITPNVTVQEIFQYVVTIDGVEYAFTSDGTPTAAEVVTGLTALIDGDAACPADASGTNTLILTSKQAGVPFVTSVGDRLALVETTPSHGVVEDMVSASATDDDWYMLLLTSRNANDILAAARYIESQRRMFAACSGDAAVKTNATTDIASQLEAREYARTFLFFSDDQVSYPEAGWAGGLLPRDPGSETWKFKTIVGSLASLLSSTQETNLKNKNANYMVSVGGVNITTEGVVAEGEFIDVIRFIDWLHARMTEKVFARLVSLPKVPYTDTGVSQIEGDVWAVLEAGINAGGLARDPAPVVTVPKVADIDSQDRAARLLPDIEFTATLAGAIHAVEITGVVSV